MSEVQIAIIDQEDTQITLAVPGVQGPVGNAIPSGGTTNQVLFKTSATDYDATWGGISSAMITDLAIVNADINASAAIVDTKLATIATALKVSNSATTATDANTASAIVARNASGNFTAGTITAALTGAASSNVLKAGDTMTGALVVPAGTVTANGIQVGTGTTYKPGIYSPGADELAISTNGTQRATVDSSGRLLVGTSTATANGGVLGLSGGITFPATAVAASNANTLDDYEEGTWTPTVIGTTTAGTVTYAVQNARYTKIGRVVSIEILLNWSAGTGTGNFRISGLPFTSSSSVTTPALALTFCSNIAMTASHILTVRIADNSTQIEFLSYPSGGGAYATVVYDAEGVVGVAGSYSV
jgi:hypothetical protein